MLSIGQIEAFKDFLCNVCGATNRSAISFKGFRYTMRSNQLLLCEKDFNPNNKLKRIIVADVKVQYVYGGSGTESGGLSTNWGKYMLNTQAEEVASPIESGISFQKLSTDSKLMDEFKDVIFDYAWLTTGAVGENLVMTMEGYEFSWNS